jgi:hypothetical protein
MNREVHVRFCEGVGVKFPRATRPLIHTPLEFALAQDVEGCQDRLIRDSSATMIVQP